MPTLSIDSGLIKLCIGAFIDDCYDFVMLLSRDVHLRVHLDNHFWPLAAERTAECLLSACLAATLRRWEPTAMPLSKATEQSLLYLTLPKWSETPHSMASI